MAIGNKKTSILIPVILLLVAMLSIQSGATLAKSLFSTLGAQGVTALRLGIGTLFLCLFLRPWTYKPTQKITFKIIRSLVAYGISLGGMNLLFYMSLLTLPLGIAVAIEFTGPLAVAMFASKRLIDFLWVLLVMLGLYFLLPINQSINTLDPLGVTYAMGAGICWAIYIIFGKRSGKHFGTQAVALGAIIGSMLILPIGIYNASDALFSLAILPVAVTIAFLSTALPYSLEMVALTHLPTKTFGTLMSLEPAIGALCGLFFLNEILTLIQWLALGMIILASIGATITIKPNSSINSLNQHE